MLSWTYAPQAKAFRISKWSSFMKKLGVFQAAASAVGPKGLTKVSPSSLLWTVSEFALVLWVSCMHPHLPSKLGISGLYLSRRSLKIEVPGEGPNICLLRRSLELWVPSSWFVTAEGGVYGEIVSQPLTRFDTGFFVIHLMYESRSASLWISFRWNCSVCNWRFSVSVERGEFRGLLCHHF